MREIFLLLFCAIGFIHARKNYFQRNKEKKSTYLLPGNVIPQKYNITLHTYLEKCTNVSNPCYYDGTVKIHFYVIHATKEIILHSYKDINVANATIKPIVEFPPVTTDKGVTESAGAIRGKRDARRGEKKGKNHRKSESRKITLTDEYDEDVFDCEGNIEDIETPDIMEGSYNEPSSPEPVPSDSALLSETSFQPSNRLEADGSTAFNDQQSSNNDDNTQEASSTEAVPSESSELPTTSDQPSNSPGAESLTSSNEQQSTPTGSNNDHSTQEASSTESVSLESLLLPETTAHPSKRLAAESSTASNDHSTPTGSYDHQTTEEASSTESVRSVSSVLPETSRAQSTTRPTAESPTASNDQSTPTGSYDHQTSQEASSPESVCSVSSVLPETSRAQSTIRPAAESPTASNDQSTPTGSYDHQTTEEASSTESVRSVSSVLPETSRAQSTTRPTAESPTASNDQSTPTGSYDHQTSQEASSPESVCSVSSVLPETSSSQSTNSPTAATNDQSTPTGSYDHQTTQEASSTEAVVTDSSVLPGTTARPSNRLGAEGPTATNDQSTPTGSYDSLSSREAWSTEAVVTDSSVLPETTAQPGNRLAAESPTASNDQSTPTGYYNHQTTQEASSTEAVVTASSVQMETNSEPSSSYSPAGESPTDFDDQQSTLAVGDPAVEDATTSAAVNRIKRHARKIHKKALDLNGVEVKVGKYDNKTMMLMLELPKEIPAGLYELTIVFSAIHGLESQGFHVSTKKGDKKGYMLSTQFEADLARNAFPCFDEPRWKAHVAMTVTISKELKNQGYHVLSNMPLESIETPKEMKQEKRKRKSSGRNKMNRRQDTQSDRVTYVFKQTPFPISTYLIAVVVSDFKSARSTFVSSYDNSTEKKPFRTWAPAEFLEKGYTLNNSQYLGPRILEHFTKKYGIGYPLPKIDQIFIPGFKIGAMENWGLIAYKESFLLPASNGSINSQLTSIRAITHELAHQWFGNLVSMDWWSNLWLNEGFATFNEPMVDEFVTDINNDSLSGMDVFISGSVLAKAFFEDSSPESLALSAPVYTTKEIDEKFGPIVSAKGGAVIRMWMHCLGEEVFYNGVKNYLKDNAFGTATPKKLMKIWDDTAMEFYGSDFPFPVDIPTLFADWYKKPGYPVIKVARKGEKYVLTQERFVLRGGTQDLESKETADRWIPITISTETEPNFNNLTPIAYFEKGTDQLEIEIPVISRDAAWYILNNQISGFYRVLYDEENWKAIKLALEDPEGMKGIHVYNRAQILDDAFHFGVMENAPYMNIHEAFTLSTYLLNERSFVVWRSWSRNMRLILSQLKGMDREMDKHLTIFVQGIANAAINKFGSEDPETPNTRLLVEELNQLTMHLKSAEGQKRIEFFDTPPRWSRAKRLKLTDLNVLAIIQQKESLMKWVAAWCEKGNCNLYQ